MDTPLAPPRRPGVWLVACAVAFLACTGFHEWVARRSGSVPNLVDDEALWSVNRMRVDRLGKDDVVLLGASRMQTDLDERALGAGLGGRTAINLAISGKQTSWPVFADIVRSTSFAGIVLLDETEDTLATGHDQQPFVDAYHRDFTLDRRCNRDIETWLQERLVCVGFGQSSTKLLLSLLGRGRPPARVYTVTDADRFTRSHFDWARPDLLASIRAGRLAPAPEGAPAPERSVDEAVARWKPLLDAFRSRGGRPVFVRLPTGPERWRRDGADGRAARYWDAVMAALGVPSIHADRDAELSRFDSPDASHIDARDVEAFTTALLARLEGLLGDGDASPTGRGGGAGAGG